MKFCAGLSPSIGPSISDSGSIRDTPSMVTARESKNVDECPTLMLAIVTNWRPAMSPTCRFATENSDHVGADDFCFSPRTRRCAKWFLARQTARRRLVWEHPGCDQQRARGPAAQTAAVAPLTPRLLQFGYRIRARLQVAFRNSRAGSMVKSTMSTPAASTVSSFRGAQLFFSPPLTDAPTHRGQEPRRISAVTLS